MSRPAGASDAAVDIRALLVVIAAAVIGVAVIAGLARGEGPGSRCELRGGLMLVGPGGETACLDPATFLPMDEPTQP